MTKLKDSDVNGLLAANPNTPARVLHKLWLKHPLGAVENPILLFWSLREGKPVHELLSLEVKTRLYLELRSAGDDNGLESILPEIERLKWLGLTNSPSQCAPSRGATSAPPSTRVPVDLQLKDAGDHSATLVYRRLATDPSSAVRAGLALVVDEIPFTATERFEVLHTLALDASPEVRRCAASSRHIDSGTHLQLAGDADSRVRDALAGNPNILNKRYMEGWQRLLASGHGRTIALNPAGPERLKLQMISGGSPDEKRAAWAGLRFHQISDWYGLNCEIQQVIADPVRIAELLEIARNPTIGGSLKSRLLAHSDARVTRAVATQKHLPEQVRLGLLFHPDIKTALRAAKHAPPADFLDAAAAHPDYRVRGLLAKKTGDKMWTLRARLVSDPDPRVRIALFRGLPEERPHNNGHRLLHKHIVEKYAADKDPRIRLLARKHPLGPQGRNPKHFLP